MNSIIHTPILQAMELFVDSNVDIGVEANDTRFVDEKTCLLLSIIIRVIVEVPNHYGLLLEGFDGCGPFGFLSSLVCLLEGTHLIRIEN
jgi:hypothetical protein